MPFRSCSVTFADDGLSLGWKRAITSPFRLTRNLVKFQGIAPANLGLVVVAREELVERIDPLALDDDLREEREADLILGRAELLDLFVGPGLLRAKLVGGEGQDLESLALVFLVDRLQVFVLGGTDRIGWRY